MKRCLALLLLLICFPAFAAEDNEATLRILDCGRQLCIVPGADLKALVENNNKNYERAEALEAELKKLREMKGCAKLEVTEPSKALKIPIDPKSLKRG